MYSDCRHSRSGGRERGQGQTANLVRLWREHSAELDWVRRWPGEWFSAGIAGLAAALVSDGDLVAAAAVLGSERAAAGVQLGEARDDVRVGLTLAGIADAEAAAVVDALTDAWTERSLGDLLTASCVDPLTSLASPSYLRARLREVYASSASVEIPAAQWYSLVTVRVASTRRSGLAAETGLIVVHAAMLRAFRSGETFARLGPTTAGVLTALQGDSLIRAIDELRLRLAEARINRSLPTTRITIESLPVALSEATGWVRRISRGA